MEEELKRITSKILDEARAKGDEIISQGARDAKNIVEEAQVRSRAAAERLIKEAERDAEQGKKRLVADAILKARKKKLDAREDIIGEAFSRAEENLLKIAGSPKYPSILENLITEACTEIGDGGVEVIVRKKDAKNIEKRFSNLEKVLKEKGINVKLSLSKETTNELGVIARISEGRVEVSNTLNSRLERIKPTLRLEVAKILFK
ncbi:MAG: V-type ATP synthase subunit E [Candidatus Hydrothermarchaeaceae archaeon]